MKPGGGKRTVDEGCPWLLVVSSDVKSLRIQEWLSSTRFEVVVVDSLDQALQRLQHSRAELVILDGRQVDLSRPSVVEALKQIDAQATLLVDRNAVRLETSQAANLDRAAAEAFAGGRLFRELENLMLSESPSPSLLKRAGVREKIIGSSPAICRVWELVEKFAPTDIPVVLQGETGTGKELLAWALHELSEREKGNLVPIDCTTLPEELFESELFGHQKGSFTGAAADKRGRVVAAEGGTLFFDELSTLSLNSQTKLLRLVEQRAFTPLGAETGGQRVDARFISATNLVLTKEIQKGTFRSDLFYRLNGVTIEVPPLRQRSGDVELLCRHFVSQFGHKYRKAHLELSDSAMDALCSYSWPGNVRELQRILSVAVVMANDQILPSHLSFCSEWRIADASDLSGRRLSIDLPYDLDSPLNLNQVKEYVGQEAERHIIHHIRARQKWNQKDLARFLNVDPKTLRARLREAARSGSN